MKKKRYNLIIFDSFLGLDEDFEFFNSIFVIFYFFEVFFFFLKIFILTFIVGCDKIYTLLIWGGMHMDIDKKNQYGSINITLDAVAAVAGNAATECYGVVGMSSKRSIKEEIKTNATLEERVVAQIKRGEIHEASDIRKLGEIIKAKSKPARKALARYAEGKETLNAAYEELKDSGQINDILQKFTRFKEYINDTDLDEKIGASQKELQDKFLEEIVKYYA